MLNRLSFGNKLLLQVLGTTFIVLGITIFFIGKYTYETSENDAKIFVQELAAKNASKIKAEVDESIAISKMMAFKYTNALKTQTPLKEEEVIEFISDILKDNSFIVGFWFKIKEKELFFKSGDPQDERKWYDKTGQFNPYIARAGSKIVINPGSIYGENLEWVKGPKEKGSTYITKPYMYPVDGVEVLMSTVAVPMYHNGEFIGTIGIDITMDTFSEMTKKTKVYENGYTFIVDHHEYIIGHPQNDIVGKKIKDIRKSDVDFETALSNSLSGKDYNFNQTSTLSGKESFYYTHSFKLKNNDNWTFFVSAPVEEFLSHANFMIYFLLIAGTIAVLLIALAIFISVRKLNYNLNSISAGLNDFFKYLNKETNNPKQITLKSQDEFGAMAKSINENVESIRVGIEQDNALIEDVKQIVNYVGQGFLEKRIDKSTKTESLNELKNLLNDMLNNLESTIGKDLNKLSETLSKYMQRDFTAKLDANSAGKIGNEIIEMNRIITHMLLDNQRDGLMLQESANDLTVNMKTLSNNATSQAASLEETAASIDEITSNIQHTSQKAQEMLSISNNTKSSASEGKNLADQTAKAMEEINDTVVNINEAISVIDQIAFQTNILSLNAAVEAATAGEAGKGFAVVAAEVRNLANRSAEAAKEIKELVENATARADNGKNISSKMIEGFTSLEEKIVETSKLIDDVTNAAKEQSIGMNQIADAVGQLDKFTQENASVADKTNSIAQETNNIAIDVVQNVNKNKFDGQESNKTNKSPQKVKETSTPKTTQNNNSRKEFKSESNSDEWESF